MEFFICVQETLITIAIGLLLWIILDEAGQRFRDGVVNALTVTAAGGIFLTLIRIWAN